MKKNAPADPANPYSPPGETPPERALRRNDPLPWFCRVAFVWSLLVSLFALSPEVVGMMAGGGTDGAQVEVLAAGKAQIAALRWGFCLVGLAANWLLLSGRRAGLLPGVTFLAWEVLLFAVVIGSIRSGTSPWGNAAAGQHPAVAAVAVFAFLGGGSIGLYALALHEFRLWINYDLADRYEPPR